MADRIEVRGEKLETVLLILSEAVFFCGLELEARGKI